MNLPRHAEIWLAPYLKDRLRKSLLRKKPKRAWVAITDHYEPLALWPVVVVDPANASC